MNFIIEQHNKTIKRELNNNGLDRIDGIKTMNWTNNITKET